MSDGAARELYPEEKVLIKFLKKIWSEDFLDVGYGHSKENDDRINQMQALFSEMETAGARKEVWKLHDQLRETRQCLRKICAYLPVTELLTDPDEEIRDIGLEFQEVIERIRKDTPELVEGTTTAKEVYDNCEEWKKAQKV